MLSPSVQVPIIVSVTCLVSSGLPLQEISAHTQSLTAPSLQSQKQTLAQPRFIGGPIIRKMTSCIYKVFSKVKDALLKVCAVVSHGLVMQNKRKASLAII